MTAAASEQPAPAPPTGSSRPRVGLITKLFYGSGSIAFGVKDNGFQTFLLLFYSQLVGLPAAWVSGAIFIALVIDAFMDPIIGQTSDHLRSRWGRRASSISRPRPPAGSFARHLS